MMTNAKILIIGSTILKQPFFYAVTAYQSVGLLLHTEDYYPLFKITPL